MKLKAKEPNARRKTEGNKDFKNLFNNCLWSSYCILSSDDLKIKNTLGISQFVQGRQIQIIIIQYDKYVLTAIETLNS